MAASQDITSHTLLGQLQHDSESAEAWTTFVARYSPMIERWCRGWGLQPVDCQDITQNVMLELSRQLRRGDYKPTGKFRSWLKTIAYRAWCDYLSRCKKNNHLVQQAVICLLDSLEARSSFIAEFEREWEREILELAITRVRSRVQAHTWEAFRLMVYEHLSGDEVAKRLDIKLGSVFVAKSRIERMLIEEVKNIDPE